MKYPKPFVWSYSFLNTYLRCRLQAEARYKTKVYPYKESKEAAFGNYVHDLCEKYVKNVIAEFPEDVKPYEKWVRHIKQQPGLVVAEQQLGVTREWRPTTFFADDVWGRGKIDTTIINGDSAVFVDWKTGKEWEDPFELEVQAVLLQAHYPKIKNMAGMYCWMKAGKFGEVYDLGHTDEIRARIEKIMHQTETEYWHASRNALCGWCDYNHCAHYKDTRRK